MIFFAPCPPGAGSVLAEELKGLGARLMSTTERGVQFEGDIELAYMASLYLRTASRLLVELFSGEAVDEDALYRHVLDYPWEERFSVTADFACRVTGLPLNRNPNFVVMRIKDAIADRFTNKIGSRPTVNRKNPDVRVEVRWNTKKYTVYVNWSGPPLHQRGYRLDSTKAVLRETTAAAILLMSEWPSIAAGDGAFADPVCGSGTLLVEAALIASGAPPAINRKEWGFFAWSEHKESLWEKINRKASIHYGKALNSLPPLIGSDIDSSALRSARANLRRAGLNHAVQLSLHDITQGTPANWTSAASGLVCADPPYGHRYKEDPTNVYQALGKFFRTLKEGWHLALLAPDKKTAALSYLKADKYRETVSGGTEIILALYRRQEKKPNSLISRSSENLARRFPDYEDAKKKVPEEPQPIPELPLDPSVSSLRKALLRNIEALSKWAEKTGVFSYRIWDSDLPEYNAAVDWYEGQWLHVQEFQAPAKVPKEKTEMRLRTLLVVLKELTDSQDEDIYVKQHLKGIRPYQKMRNTPDRVIIRENGARFFVDFSSYIDTGIFLDHRPLRARIQNEIGTGRFLNLFSYTGTVSVMAAMGGASSTVSIDVSNTYTAWTQSNLNLNKCFSKSNICFRSDAQKWLAKDTSIFDMIFIDPPTYSNGAGREDWSVHKDHGALICQAMEKLSPNGVLFFSENARHFSMDSSIMKKFSVKEITRETLDPDFIRRGKAHRCWELRLP